jgi:hypothetical protein
MAYRGMTFEGILKLSHNKIIESRLYFYSAAELTKSFWFTVTIMVAEFGIFFCSPVAVGNKKCLVKAATTSHVMIEG